LFLSSCCPVMRLVVSLIVVLPCLQFSLCPVCPASFPLTLRVLLAFRVSPRPAVSADLPLSVQASLRAGCPSRRPSWSLSITYPVCRRHCLGSPYRLFAYSVGHPALLWLVSWLAPRLSSLLRPFSSISSLGHFSSSSPMSRLVAPPCSSSYSVLAPRSSIFCRLLLHCPSCCGVLLSYSFRFPHRLLRLSSLDYCVAVLPGGMLSR